MKRIGTIACAALLAAGTLSAAAQEASAPWSLEACIDYAYEHNIDLKQKREAQESRKVDLHTS